MELAVDQSSRTALLLRRPLLLVLILGCTVSLLASGRLTLRLVLDGGLSFAFVPLCELVAFTIVYRWQRDTRPLIEAADRYFAGDTAWLWWLLAFASIGAIIPAQRLGSLLAPILFTAPIPIVLSIRADWRLHRNNGRTRSQAALDVFLQRAIAWSLATAYFLGIAITRRDALYLFVEASDEITRWARTVL
jgi:hypothetical protein